MSRQRGPVNVLNHKVYGEAGAIRARVDKKQQNQHSARLPRRSGPFILRSRTWPIPSRQRNARQAEAHRARNAAQRSALRSAIKTVRVAVDKKDKDGAQSAFRTASSVIDRMARKGFNHKNATARYKSGLNRRCAFWRKPDSTGTPNKSRLAPAFLFLQPAYITTMLSRWMSSGSSTYPKIVSIWSLGLPMIRRVSSAP